jgi:hypothetical protein
MDLEVLAASIYSPHVTKRFIESRCKNLTKFPQKGYLVFVRNLEKIGLESLPFILVTKININSHFLYP